MHSSLVFLLLFSLVLIVLMITCFVCFIRSKKKEDEEFMEQVQYTSRQQQQQAQQQQLVAAAQQSPKLSQSPSNNLLINDPVTSRQLAYHHHHHHHHQQQQQQQQQQMDPATGQIMVDYASTARSAYAPAPSPYHASPTGVLGAGASPRTETRSDITQQINSAVIGSSEAEFQNDFIQVFPMYQIAPQPEKNTTPYLT